MKKIGMWFLLLLSVFCAGLYWKYLVQEFLNSYWLIYKYTAVAISCSCAVYYLGRELEMLPRAEKKSSQPTVSLEHPKILKFIEDNRELLERALAGPAKIELAGGYPMNQDLIGHLLTPEKQISLSNSVDWYRCNYRLHCSGRGKEIFIKFFTRDGRVIVPFDPKNTDHQDLLNHLNWMIRDYGAIVRATEQPAIAPNMLN